MIEDIITETSSRMNKAIDALRSDYLSIRTGRASPAIVDRLMVDYYGTPTPLQQLASITAPEAQMLVIRPYAVNDIPAIERAIAVSDLGLTPNNDGQQIRLTIPHLTEDRRRDLSKMVGKRAEEGRIAIRNIRRDAISDLREAEKEGIISEDELRRGQDRVQERTDQHIKLVDAVTKEKEEEIMTL